MTTTEGRPIAALGRLRRARSTEEQCELCSINLSHQHRHLLEVANGRLLCACEPCALRFENVIGRFRLIPREPRALHLSLADEFWEGLSIPINLAFFSYRTPAQRVVVMYPSPAGVTESLLPMTNWEAFTLENPSLAAMEKDVEALLINRIESKREYFIVPIDFCFHLVGLVRMHWRGLSGDAIVWQKLEEFFAGLRAQCGSAPQILPKPDHA